MYSTQFSLNFTFVSSFLFLFFSRWRDANFDILVFRFLGGKKKAYPMSSRCLGRNGEMECGSGMFGSGPGPMSKDHLGVYWGGGRLFQMFVGFFVGGGMRLARQYVELFMLFLKLQGSTVGFFFGMAIMSRAVGGTLILFFSSSWFLGFV